MRLLLLTTAAIVAQTGAFSLNFFSTEAEKPYLHAGSPALTDPSSARVKRQAYQVYVDGDSTVSVDKSGQAETGAWGQWSSEAQCSRTCGGGVQVEKRQCSGECTGPSVRYVSCNLEPCSEGTDFRAEQCAKHNDDALDGNYHKWIPYKGKNKCELLCKPEIGNFYYKWAENVVDGTTCDSFSDDICVEGVCLPIGCDGKLGSAKKVDKCGVCDGDGSTCKTIEGGFDERNLSPGYHDVMKLPVGATAIKIIEARPSSNNLALKNSSGHFYLNGNGMLQVEKEVIAGGAVFEYDDDKPERITASGPLKEEITVSLLFRKGNKDAAIKYEFSIPLEEEVDYMYKPGDWSECSVTCGKGLITRTPFCIDTKTQARVNDDLCDQNNATKPEFEKECETVDCAAEWFEGEWEQCSQSCGDNGEQYRVVYCHQIFANGRRITVDDGNCTATRPSVRQSCNRFSCPEWQAGPWSACSEKCGEAHQYRSVTCRSEKEGEEGKLLPAESCDADVQLETQRTCNLGPCEGLTFQTTEWKLCSKCNDTEETREVTCKDTNGRAYPLEKCLTDNSTEIPIDTRSCATVQPCVYEWTASQWSRCSTECGHGHQTRRVVCAIHQLGDLEVVDEGLCQGEKPEERKNCTNEEKCTGTWYTGPWTQCTLECGGGEQERLTVCLNYDKKPVPEWCDEAEKPAEKQECNAEACPTCFDSDFGCCPDNSTFATGEYFFGCSNCSETEFGCCGDNVTEATGANLLGCPEFVESVLSASDLKEAETAAEGVEGSGDAEPAECQVTNENGDEATVDCKAANLTATEDFDLLGNETIDGNATIHCSKTEFGCCPDWYTPASGKNNEGCESFVLGNCNGTEFGCCIDEVTLSRGANYEGCGEPSCAASLYGCCKDRKTIAFGPHYAGCERSSFPCELSTFGCCPDGETAALGKNGTGCGENCLTTKFGCCPDGKTTSKGHNNEGCGCEFSQYGCCPDGKSVAKGSSFLGCPESCAQKQFGCCPDGKTAALGANKEGCPCQYTRYGCCPDGETTSLGPKLEGCDDCRYGKHGCCPDGITKARGPNEQGCPATTTPPFIIDGTVSPLKIQACELPQDTGSVCNAGYKLAWYYDVQEGRCSQFWFGGCGGNENRFQTKEMCETICVEPPGKGRCYLPKIEGPKRCQENTARYYYDVATNSCRAFWWSGCLGNANNFADWEECSKFCDNVKAVEAPAPVVAEQPQAPYEYQPIDIDVAVQNNQPVDPRPVLTMEEICRLNLDSGACDTFSERFYYDASRGSCQPFTFGGCGGNTNNFRTSEECYQRCGFLNPNAAAVAQQHLQQAPQQQSRQEVIIPPNAIVERPAPIVSSDGKSREACQMKIAVGTCKGAFESWYYEVATGSCVTFKYSGCGGNGNRFTSQQACEDLCVAPAAQVIPDGPPGSNAVCDEAKDTGPCNNFTTKWYYNKADGTCARFHYGGCQGTGNRFENEQDCKAACSNHKDLCSLPKVQGPCSGKHLYYYFNQATNKCETFTFGGCLGNTNRFSTVEECNARCPQQQQQRQQPQEAPANMISLAKNAEQSQLQLIPTGHKAYEVIQSHASLTDRCFLPKETGRCRNVQVKYHYDATLGQCVQFYYSGCDGNDNRFDSEEECQSLCSPHQALTIHDNYNIAADGSAKPLIVDGIDSGKYESINPVRTIESFSTEQNDLNLRMLDKEEHNVKIRQPVSSSIPELCQLPEEKGSCFGSILRWRYNTETSGCVAFLFSGCDGNANHFTSLESCERACGTDRDVDVCSLEMNAGDCEESVTKWYYSSRLGRCQMMLYTGCGGNGNRFSSREECESLCKEEMHYGDQQNICNVPRSSGPCQDAISMWYYDKPMKECRLFTYSGCRGSKNRFISKGECEEACHV
ncbi:unnamed protein product [Auanema sp. JU1783]|nr:unnamed protein product [Auanema sp. JU1783]